MLIYIHGFNSSPASHKARLLRQAAGGDGPRSAFSCPALPDRPAQAIELLRSAVARYPAGSRSRWWAARWVATTPPISRKSSACVRCWSTRRSRRYEGLRAYLGPQKNLYTGESLRAHRAASATSCEALDVDRPTRLDRYYLMVTTGDEVLDYRDAVRKYAGREAARRAGQRPRLRDFGDIWTACWSSPASLNSLARAFSLRPRHFAIMPRTRPA